MSITDFEPDPDFLSLDGVSLQNDPQGRLVANAVEAEEFDPGISSDVEGLLLLGYLTHKSAIFGHTFILKTLTRGERLAVVQFVKEYEESLGIAMALETATLAMSLINVDGRPLTIPLSEADRIPEVTLARNYAVISKWYDPLLDALYLEYQDLRNRADGAFLELQGKLTAGRRQQQP
jgi:hypothetical protein